MARYDFTSPGAAGGNAIEQFLMQRALMQRQAMLDAAKQTQDQAQNRRADEELQLQKATAANAEKDRERQAKTQAAGIAVSQARPGQALTPAVIAQIQGTPFEARLQTQDTLPAKFGDPMNPQTSGSESMTTLAPTLDQEVAQGQRTRRNELAQTIQNADLNDPNLRRTIAASAAQNGESVPANLLTDPNKALQDRLAEIQAQGDQSARVAGINASGRTSPDESLVQRDNGDGTYTWVRKGSLEGTTGKKSPGVTVANRMASAKAVAQTGDDIISELKDPAYAAQVGPVLGRYKNLQDFIGNPPPEYAQLAGQIESYALANMGVHGMRSTQGAEMIKGLLTAKHTPQSLIAAINGLNGFSQHFIENEGGGGAQPTTSTKTSSFRVVGQR